ncbi:hypothetical protein Cni_G07302 [Canna indica]|uniref:Uncharacterized protein n=1 Tax=Canna indica TaxID=4628 RepID=A0AAQ3Q6R9_9LILI|nr:hypothetical protein Cni_G07302 [Canna indica]
MRSQTNDRIGAREGGRLRNVSVAIDCIHWSLATLTKAIRLGNFHERHQSNYVGSFARRVRYTEIPNDVTLLKELYRSDPERVIRLFESQPSLHSNPSALAEYVKALVKVDRLDQSTLLRTLQRGKNNACA